MKLNKVEFSSGFMFYKTIESKQYTNHKEGTMTKFEISHSLSLFFPRITK